MRRPSPRFLCPQRSPAPLLRRIGKPLGRFSLSARTGPRRHPASPATRHPAGRAHDGTRDPRWLPRERTSGETARIGSPDDARCHGGHPVPGNPAACPPGPIRAAPSVPRETSISVATMRGTREPERRTPVAMPREVPAIPLRRIAPIEPRLVPRSIRSHRRLRPPTSERHPCEPEANRCRTSWHDDVSHPRPSSPNRSA